MGLGTSPTIWMTYINFLLDSMTDRDKIIAIMDDLLLHSTRDTHMCLLVNLFETMIKNGLKLSPKKSQLFNNNNNNNNKRLFRSFYKFSL